MTETSDTTQTTETTAGATIAAALQRTEPLTSAECITLRRTASERLREIEPRLEALKPGNPHTDRLGGPERCRVLSLGTAEDVAAMNREHDTLRAEADQLRAQLEELSRLRAEASVREASESMPARQAELAKAAARTEALAREYAEALSDLDTRAKGIAADRGRVRLAGLPAAAADAETIEAIARLRNWRPPPTLICSQHFAPEDLGADRRAGRAELLAGGMG